jgi:uncharacterized protein with NRDE domain
MCLTFFFLNPRPESGSFSLILVFNRDEFLTRPTAAAEWKEDILAGRDLAPGKEGGTWSGAKLPAAVGANLRNLAEKRGSMFSTVLTIFLKFSLKKWEFFLKTNIMINIGIGSNI